MPQALVLFNTDDEAIDIRDWNVFESLSLVEAVGKCPFGGPGRERFSQAFGMSKEFLVVADLFSVTVR